MDGYASACWDLHLWPENVNSMSSGSCTYVTWFGSLPAVTSIFDLWHQNLISTSMKSNISMTKIWWNFLNWFWYMVFTRFSDYCLLWPRPLMFWPQNLISIFLNLNTYVNKIGWNFLYWFLPCDCMWCNARYCCCNSVRLSVRRSDACIVTKLNDGLRIFWYHTKRQSL